MDALPELFAPQSHLWLNTAHQGPLPLVAEAAAEEAVKWKLDPHQLQDLNRFREVPERLRVALATLLGAEEDDTVLANSASYGLHLVARGLPLQAGDEILVPANDFPSDILPWLQLRSHGVTVKAVEPVAEVLTAEEVEQQLTPRTRVLCLTWVHSFSGHITDLTAIGNVCRANGVWLVVNGSQGVGALPLDVREVPIDALVSVGFKWLCGPYGTGLCWIRPELRDQIRPQKLYWLQALAPEDLANERLDLNSLDPPSRGRLDIFGTANFFNFLPFAAAVEMLLHVGVDAVTQWDQTLVSNLIQGLDRQRYELLSPETPSARSTIVTVKPTMEASSDVVARLAAADVDVAERFGRVRFSPHVHNSGADIDALLSVL